MSERLRFKKTRAFVDWEDPIEDEQDEDYFSRQRDEQEVQQVVADTKVDGGESAFEKLVESVQLSAEQGSLVAGARAAVAGLKETWAIIKNDEDAEVLTPEQVKKEYGVEVAQSTTRSWAKHMQARKEAMQELEADVAENLTWDDKIGAAASIAGLFIGGLADPTVIIPGLGPGRAAVNTLRAARSAKQIKALAKAGERFTKAKQAASGTKAAENSLRTIQASQKATASAKAADAVAWAVAEGGWNIADMYGANVINKAQGYEYEIGKAEVLAGGFAPVLLKALGNSWMALRGLKAARKQTPGELKQITQNRIDNVKKAAAAAKFDDKVKGRYNKAVEKVRKADAAQAEAAARGRLVEAAKQHRTATNQTLRDSVLAEEMSPKEARAIKSRADAIRARLAGKDMTPDKAAKALKEMDSFVASRGVKKAPREAIARSMKNFADTVVVKADGVVSKADLLDARVKAHTKMVKALEGEAPAVRAYAENRLADARVAQMQEAVDNYNTGYAAAKSGDDIIKAVAATAHEPGRMAKLAKEMKLDQTEVDHFEALAYGKARFGDSFMDQLRAVKVELDNIGAREVDMMEFFPMLRSKQTLVEHIDNMKTQRQMDGTVAYKGDSEIADSVLTLPDDWSTQILNKIDTPDMSPAKTNRGIEKPKPVEKATREQLNAARAEGATRSQRVTAEIADDMERAVNAYKTCRKGGGA